MEDATQEAVLLLGNSRSKKRVSGAKRLRKLGDPAAGPALLEALQKEVKDVRTWEAQYLMALALGCCGYAPALPFLDELARRDVRAPALYTGLGDAIFRLLVLSRSPDDALDRIYGYANHRITYGGLRALAMLRLVPSDDAIRRVIAVGSDPVATCVVMGHPGDETGLRLWVAVASTDWPMELKSEFLSSCDEIQESQLSMAVSDSRQGKLGKWRAY